MQNNVCVYVERSKRQPSSSIRQHTVNNTMSYMQINGSIKWASKMFTTRIIIIDCLQSKWDTGMNGKTAKQHQIFKWYVPMAIRSLNSSVICILHHLCYTNKTDSAVDFNCSLWIGIAKRWRQLHLILIKLLLFLSNFIHKFCIIRYYYLVHHWKGKVKDIVLCGWRLDVVCGKFLIELLLLNYLFRSTW